MSEDYFGWRPVSVPYPYGGNSYFPYDYSDPNQRYEPTVWDKNTTNIETMWGWIQNESDERVLAVAEMWRRIGVLLESTRNNLQRYATALAAKWESPAGEYFMQRVGATLYSLDEWRDAADSNCRGLEQLASTIKTAQQNFRSLWEQYIVEAADPDKGLQWSDTYDWIPGLTGRTRQDVMDDYFERARDIIKPLADTYIDVYISHITQGTVFKGPTDAAVVYEEDLPIGGPGAPPGAPGGAPGAPPGAPRPGLPNTLGLDAPAAPPVGGQPQPAPPPPLPDGLNLAGGTVTAPAPPPVATTPPGGVGPAPSPPPAVLPPGATPPGPRPGNPGTVRPNLPPTPGGNRPNAPARPPGPPRPALPGAGGAPPANNPGARGPAPKRPSLPGSTGPAGSGARPPAPGSRPAAGRTAPPAGPQLPGSTSGRPARPAGSNAARPAAPPPSLGGQRPRPAAGKAPGPARLPAPANPGATAKPAPVGPQLPGRAGPTKASGSVGRGPGPTLGGQRGPVPSGNGSRQQRKSDDQQQSWEYGDGDDQLWETESAAAGTIDTPVERRPKEQGRSLGQL